MEFSLNGTENFVTEFAEHLGKTREITLHRMSGPRFLSGHWSHVLSGGGYRINAGRRVS